MTEEMDEIGKAIFRQRDRLQQHYADLRKLLVPGAHIEEVRKLIHKIERDEQFGD